MKTFNLSAFCGVAVVTLICGCASAPTGNDRPLPLKYYTRAELEDMGTVQLPSNYSVDNFKKLQLGGILVGVRHLNVERQPLARIGKLRRLNVLRTLTRV